LSEKQDTTSPETEISVSRSATSERSTGTRNASSEGDRRRRSDENIAAEAIGGASFSKLAATLMLVSGKERVPQGKGRNLEGWKIFPGSVFWVSKRWWHAMKQFRGGWVKKFERLKR